IAVYPVLLLTWILILWVHPLWLFHINQALPDFTDVKLPDWLGGIKLPIRYAILVGFFRYRPRVLEAWVANRISSARLAFSTKLTVKARDVHIPVPVVLNGENIPSLAVDDLRPVYAKKMACLVVWGEGGSGKTSLTCLIAKWGMSEEKGYWLCRDHPMLPVLIEQDLEPTTRDADDPFLRTISNQLKALIDEEERIPLGLLRHLLKRRHLLVIVDGLSEMNEASRASILTGITYFSVNAAIITSRVDEPMTDLSRGTIKPLRIRGGRLSTFIEAYLTRRGKRDLFEDEEFFDACGRLSRMVGDRDITALLAKLYAEQMIAAKEERGAGDDSEEAFVDDSPDNIPDLMLKYIVLIYGKPGANAPDIRAVLSAAKAIAWECLKETLR